MTSQKAAPPKMACASMSGPNTSGWARQSPMSNTKYPAVMAMTWPVASVHANGSSVGQSLSARKAPTTASTACTNETTLALQRRRLDLSGRLDLRGDDAGNAGDGAITYRHRNAPSHPYICTVSSGNHPSIFGVRGGCAARAAKRKMTSAGEFRAVPIRAENASPRNRVASRGRRRAGRAVPSDSCCWPRWGVAGRGAAIPAPRRGRL